MGLQIPDLISKNTELRTIYEECLRASGMQIRTNYKLLCKKFDGDYKALLISRKIGQGVIWDKSSHSFFRPFVEAVDRIFAKELQKMQEIRIFLNSATRNATRSPGGGINGHFDSYFGINSYLCQHGAVITRSVDFLPSRRSKCSPG